MAEPTQTAERAPADYTHAAPKHSPETVIIRGIRFVFKNRSQQDVIAGLVATCQEAASTDEQSTNVQG